MVCIFESRKYAQRWSTAMVHISTHTQGGFGREKSRPTDALTLTATKSRYGDSGRDYSYCHVGHWHGRISLSDIARPLVIVADKEALLFRSAPVQLIIVSAARRHCFGQVQTRFSYS